MIAELESFEPAAQERILSRIAASLLPDPGVETSHPLPEDEEADRVLSSLRNRLVHGKRGVSEDALLTEAVADAFFSRYMTADKLGEVRTRLGDRGELEPDQATIIYNQDVEILGRIIVLKRKDVDEALYNPDATERISGESFAVKPGSFPVVSLRIKRHRVQSVHAHSVVLICVHEADKIKVWQAFRVYDRDVGLSENAQPSTVLQRFVEMYGVSVFIEGKQATRKLVLEETFLKTTPGPLPNFQFEKAPGGPVAQVAYCRVTEAGSVAVAFAYGIRLDTYVRDLAKHGIPVKLKELNKQNLKSTSHFLPLKFTEG